MCDVRDNARSIIYNFLKVNNTITKSVLKRIAKNIEKSIYNHSVENADKKLILPEFTNIQFLKIYNITSNKITSQLESNQDFVNNILNGKIDLNKIGSMKLEKLNPEYYEKNTEYIRQRNEKKEISGKHTILHKCFKCGHNECTERSVQIRALDEGTNLEITCLYCDNKWIT